MPRLRNRPRNRSHIAAPQARRGLAPLELVLSLPILLCVMALIVNFGIGTKWKLRSLFAVRQAAWSQRGDRNGRTDPRPAGWPAAAVYEVLPGGSDLFPNDPYASYPVVRGPVLQDPQAPDAHFFVDTNMLQVAAGLFRGHARIDRDAPFLPKVAGVHFDVEHLLTESRWRYQDFGYRSNQDRRTLLLYSLLPKPDTSEYQEAAMEILNFDRRRDLDPLDRDREFLWWTGSMPDFHQTLLPGCTFNPAIAIDELVSRIKGPKGDGKGGVPENMSRAFSGLYGSVLGDLRSGGKKYNTLPPPPEDADWQKKIDDLKGFP